jgi:hypothetical protein
MTWDGVMVPIPAMGENVFMRESRGHVIGDSHSDDMDQSPTLGLEEGGQLLQRLGQVAHMAKNTHGNYLVKFLGKLNVI